MSEYITTALQEEEIKTAQEKLAELIRSDFARIDRMKADEEVTDFSKLDTITIGVMPGDGIGPLIMTQALRVLNQLLAPEIANLAPRKLKGIVSEGMILSAENNDGSLAVIMPQKEVKPGSEVK